MKIGILREGKNPPDKRVPLTPGQCKELLNKYPQLSIDVQPSPIRAITDEEYRKEGISLKEDLKDCDVLMGIKEVPIAALIPNKKYFFFSHTIKKQPYNRNLLRRILELKIELIDYETLTYKNGARVLGFGRYAGIVGTYNAFLGLGLRTGLFTLKPAHDCTDFLELKEQFKKIQLPPNYRIVLTGKGRVGGGAREILGLVGIKEVNPKDFLTESYIEPVYTILDIGDYFVHQQGLKWNMETFLADPSAYKSVFMDYARLANMYIACHYWSAPSPYIFTRSDAKSKDFKIDLIADISCDIDGPVASTIRSSTIEAPFYGYNPQTEEEIDFKDEKAIGVLAVDNLPCELPRDASEGFGNDLCKFVLPCLLEKDKDKILERGTIAKNGNLTRYFSYLQNFVEGKDLLKGI